MDCGSYKLYLSVCVSASTAYILLTMGRILIKLGENVGTLVRLIALKFHKIYQLGRAGRDIGEEGT